MPSITALVSLVFASASSRRSDARSFSWNDTDDDGHRRSEPQVPLSPRQASTTIIHIAYLTETRSELERALRLFEARGYLVQTPDDSE
jgi:hypothetical protein